MKSTPKTKLNDLKPSKLNKPQSLIQFTDNPIFFKKKIQEMKFLSLFSDPTQGFH